MPRPYPQLSPHVLAQGEATAGSGGGGTTNLDWEVIGTFSAAAGASIDSTFWAAALYLEIEVTLEDIVLATDAQDIEMRVSTDGSTFDSGATDYRYNLKGFQSDAGADFEVEGDGNDNLQITDNQGNAAGEQASGKINWLSADDTGSTSYAFGHMAYLSATPTWVNAIVTGFRVATGAIRGIQVLSSSGNITGTIVVRGRRVSGSAEIVTSTIHVRDEKTASTVSGTFTQDVWQTRVLNDEVTNSIVGASLASNQITLPVGTYEIEASAPAFRVGRHKAKLRDTTGASDLLLGTSEFCDDSSIVTSATRSVVRGRFTLSVESVLELQHRCEVTSVGTNGFGVESNFSVVEVYTDVIIRQIVT